MNRGDVIARNRGLALISRINRWMIAGAVGLAGLISLVAAHSFHGRTLSSSNSLSSTPAPSASNSSANQAGGGLQQPAQAPSPTQSAPGPVVSGGS
jgi:hypothetical protein